MTVTVLALVIIASEGLAASILRALALLWTAKLGFKPSAKCSYLLPFDTASHLERLILQNKDLLSPFNLKTKTFG